jgi:hypothetical protein
MSKQPWHWTTARPSRRAISRRARSSSLVTIFEARLLDNDMLQLSANPAFHFR